jgi:hypothetical protein
MSETAPSSSSPLYATKKDFMVEGFELTILDATREQEDCSICYRPIYKPECDGNTRSHDHNKCHTLEPKPKPTRLILNGNPEPGLKLNACGHVLGYTCAMTWFEQSDTCPLCRTKLFGEEKPVETWIEAVQYVTWHHGRQVTWSESGTENW